MMVFIPMVAHELLNVNLNKPIVINNRRRPIPIPIILGKRPINMTKYWRVKYSPMLMAIPVMW
jgi:hypothetical protein